MSNIFGHGRLRLYLLKLLDESPRHGYEIISLLRDRFLGVYSPSPGTIYPRLARLEEEGLVTHEEVDGRKVYRLTDAGRSELARRTEDLKSLERDLVDSAHEIARAVKRDVRDTISSLRRDLKGRGAARDKQGERPSGAGPAAGGVWEQAAAEGDTAGGSQQEPDAGSGTRWDREWERVARGLGAWGAGKDFDQTLREFSEKVRGIVHDAGQVGESAVDHLRRILDETVEAIRRDAAQWGPQERAEDPGEHPPPHEQERRDDRG